MAAKRQLPQIAAQDDGALLLGADVAKRNALLDALAGGGAKYVRANVMYGKTQGGRDLSAVDALVNAAKARGLHVQATLMGDPYYMKTHEGLTSENADPKLMAQFAGRVAKAERGRIGRYSIWNEPNLNVFLSGAQDDPRAAGRKYRGLYRAGYGAIKGADKSAQVMLGELPGHNMEEFMKGVLGGKALRTGGFAMHPYAMGAGQYDINSLPRMQALLKHYQRTGKLRTSTGKAAPLYLTEFGYQRGEMPEPQRQRALKNAYGKAAKAGARQLLYYQLDPGAPAAGTPATSDVVDYSGNVTPGSPARPPGWKWDTTTAPGGPQQLEALLRSLTQIGSTRSARGRR